MQLPAGAHQQAVPGTSKIGTLPGCPPACSHIAGAWLGATAAPAGYSCTAKRVLHSWHTAKVLQSSGYHPCQQLPRVFRSIKGTVACVSLLQAASMCRALPL
jgi:hypothetical protein